MIQTTTRPFTDAEREEIERQLSTCVSEPRADVSNALWGAFLGFICGAIFSLVAMLVIEASHILGAFMIAISVVIGTFVGWLGKLTPKDPFSDSRRHYAAVLASRLIRGEMEELTVTAYSIVRVEDANDKGDGYFFDVGDDKVVYMAEATIRDAVDDPGSGERDTETFVPSAFRLKRYPDATYQAVHFEPLGPVLILQRTIRLESVGEEYYGLADGDVFENVSLATLEIDLPFLSPAKSGT